MAEVMLRYMPTYRRADVFDDDGQPVVYEPEKPVSIRKGSDVDPKRPGVIAEAVKRALRVERRDHMLDEDGPLEIVDIRFVGHGAAR